MNIEQMLAILNPEIVERLKTAVEIGKWPNGIALTKEQREICMQAVYAWEMEKGRASNPQRIDARSRSVRRYHHCSRSFLENVFPLGQ